MQTKKVAELRRAYEGVREMKKLPDLLLVVDGKYENLALQEARKMHVPVVALLGSTGDIDMADHFVPCNVNSIKALKYILDQLRPSLARPKQDVAAAGAAKVRKIDQKPNGEELSAEDIPASDEQ
jgi:small subunit ribosomal protein S2